MAALGGASPTRLVARTDRVTRVGGEWRGEQLGGPAASWAWRGGRLRYGSHSTLYTAHCHHKATEALGVVVHNRPLYVASKRTIVCARALGIGGEEGLWYGFSTPLACPILTDALTASAAETFAYIEALLCVAPVCKQVSACGISGADATRGVVQLSSMATPCGASAPDPVVWIHRAPS